jgi:hypothetical protein
MTDAENADALFVTYKQADGQPVDGEYAWVTDLEYFADVDQPTDVVKETWTLVSRETLTVKPPFWDDDDG